MKQKHILIIGGTSGIGKAVAEEQLQLNNRVTILSRGNHPNPFEGQNATLYNADLSVPGADLPVVNSPLDGLVYCPGSIQLKPFKMLKDEDFLIDLQVNLLGAVRAVRFYLPRLTENETASVVLFSTVAVQTGMPFHSSVASAKGAVEGLGRAMAAEFAPRIRVNVIAPSITNTPLASRLLNTPEKMRSSAARHPLGKTGEPKEIAALASFLLSDMSSWMTGQILHLDGGLSVIKS